MSQHLLKPVTKTTKPYAVCATEYKIIPLRPSKKIASQKEFNRLFGTTPHGGGRLGERSIDGSSA